MLAMKPDTRLTLEKDIMIQAIPELDHYYVFNIKNGDHFRLNHTAHWILEAIESGVDYAELSRKFSQTFDLSSEQADNDLTEVINFAIENKILKEDLP